MSRTADSRVGRRAIAKNSLWNLLAQGLPLVLGIWALPFLVKHLGSERFALLSFTLVLYGNMSLFELGLGRALTKRTSELLGMSRADKVPDTLWTCVALQVGLGIVAGALLAVTCPLWLRLLTKNSETLFEEARLAVYVAAAFLPFALPSLAMRGTLESLHRFDLVNLVRAPQLCTLFLFPALVCTLHRGLPWVVAGLCSAWVLASISYLVMLRLVLPEVFDHPRICREEASSLLAFGGWVTVSSVLTPLFTHFERFALGFYGSLSLVSTYVLPAEGLQRLSVVPQSLASTLFPAFSGMGASGRNQERSRLYGSSLKSLFALIGLTIVLFVMFAPEILRLWLGKDFPTSAIIAGQILAVSVLVNCITWIPISLLHGLGRPDLTAKCHLVEVVPYILVCAVLVVRFGIVGAALAVLIRASVDAALQFRAVHKLGLTTLRPVEAGVMLLVIVVLATAIPLISVSAWKPYYGFIPVCVFCLVWWRWVLNHSDRASLLALGNRTPAREHPPELTAEPTDAY